MWMAEGHSNCFGFWTDERGLWTSPAFSNSNLPQKPPKNSGANSANLGKDSPNWVMLARENSIDRLSYSMTMYQSVRKQNFDQSTDLNELITRKPCHWQTTRLTPRRAGAVGDSPLNGLPEGPVKWHENSWLQSKVLSWVDMSSN